MKSLLNRFKAVIEILNQNILRDKQLEFEPNINRVKTFFNLGGC